MTWCTGSATSGRTSLSTTGAAYTAGTGITAQLVMIDEWAKIKGIQKILTSILPTLQVPTLVLQRQADAVVAAALGRKMAADIPGAKYIEYPNGDHAFWAGDVEALLGDIEEFVTGHRESSSNDLERVLATVLFTDIVDSTRSAADMGDQRWRALLDSHDHLARQVVEKHRGSFVKSTGDGILARFDGPEPEAARLTGQILRIWEVMNSSFRSGAG